MTDRKEIHNEDFETAEAESLEKDRDAGISADHQWGTGVNEGSIQRSDMEDQLQEDTGVNDRELNDGVVQNNPDGDLERELQEDVGLLDANTDDEVVDR